MYYCFNHNCNLWGERQAVMILAYWPQDGYLPHACRECGCGLYFHDAWDGNHRVHDNGSPVLEEENKFPVV